MPARSAHMVDSHPFAADDGPPGQFINQAGPTDGCSFQTPRPPGPVQRTCHTRSSIRRLQLLRCRSPLAAVSGPRVSRVAAGGWVKGHGLRPPITRERSPRLRVGVRFGRDDDPAHSRRLVVPPVRARSSLLRHRGRVAGRSWLAMNCRSGPHCFCQRTMHRTSALSYVFFCILIVAVTGSTPDVGDVEVERQDALRVRIDTTDSTKKQESQFGHAHVMIDRRAKSLSNQVQVTLVLNIKKGRETNNLLSGHFLVQLLFDFLLLLLKDLRPNLVCKRTWSIRSKP